jgi:hypothetical protein
MAMNGGERWGDGKQVGRSIKKLGTAIAEIAAYVITCGFGIFLGF